MKDRTVSKFVFRKIPPAGALAMVITIAFWVGIVIAPPFQTPSAQIHNSASRHAEMGGGFRQSARQIFARALLSYLQEAYRNRTLFLPSLISHTSFSANGRIEALPVPGTSVEGGPPGSGPIDLLLRAPKALQAALERGPMFKRFSKTASIRIHLENTRSPGICAHWSKGRCETAAPPRTGMPSPRDVFVPLPPPAQLKNRVSTSALEGEDAIKRRTGDK